MFDRLDDTIAAISSPAGHGLRGLIRLSGPRAIELADKVFACDLGGRLVDAEGHRRRRGRIRLEGQAESPAEVPAEAYVFRAPASYTRQDLVELHTPGSPPVLAMLLERLAASGARVAEPGEFTARAFLGGALDLTEVEGVAAMIHAQTDAQLRASETLLHGSLSRRTRGMREELADLLASIEAEIDFAEEPVEFVSPAHALDIVGRLSSDLEQLLTSSTSVERLQLLPRVVLVGMPNAGKSTLFNRLTGLDRAIQSATAGTTRDVIEASCMLRGGEVLLCDTAGLEGMEARPVDAANGAGLHERMEAATRRALAAADLILVLIDASTAPEAAARFVAERLHQRGHELVLNKMDLLHTRAPNDMLPTALARISASTGEGVDQLRSRMNEILFENTEKQGSELISLTERHRQSLVEALSALERAVHLLVSCADARPLHAELLALEIRHAIHALSLLLGEVTTEDVLGRIFARFCIGK